MLGLVLLVVAVCAIIGFFITSGLVWLVCWAFGFTFSWKLAVGVYAVMALISAAVKSNTSSK